MRKWNDASNSINLTCFYNVIKKKFWLEVLRILFFGIVMKNWPFYLLQLIFYYAFYF